MVEAWIWAAFGGFIVGMLLVDLLVFHRRAHVVGLKESLAWTVFWIAMGLSFGVIVWYWQGPDKGLEYFTGYLIEKSLSVDNLFVFLLIFAYFSVPRKDEHKVLFWGILGALVFRLLFILLGVSLIERFSWTLYIFGGILLISAVRMVIRSQQKVHPDRNPILRIFRRFVPITRDYEGDRFFVRKAGKLLATPLFVVLIVVETSDIVFAVDSVPAIFAITIDPFIVYTSNAFAIMGLRALYFALAGVLVRLHYLHLGLAAILGFVGVKILIEDFYHMPVEVALGFVGIAILVTVLASFFWPKRPADVPEQEPEGGEGVNPAAGDAEHAPGESQTLSPTAG